MPDSCVNEPLPHILKALKDAPDSPSPVVWVYPFNEYHEYKDEKSINEMFFGDWFIRGAINNGFPLSSVVSNDNFIKSYNENNNLYEIQLITIPISRKWPIIESVYFLAFSSYSNNVMIVGT